MKKVLSIAIMLLMVMTVSAGKKKEVVLEAEPLNANGEYERKTVVEVPGTTAQDLYVRALEVLSDIKGSNAKSSSQIDVQDKDAALVLYKGKIYEGFEYYSKFAGAGWDAYADFTLRIKCKDEKAQITMTVSTMTFDFNAKPSTQTIPLSELVPYTYKGNYTFKKSAIKYAPTVAPSMDALMAVICAKMKQGTDDDF